MENPYILNFNNKNIHYWVTSDEHHGHKNVIKYDNRPFDNIKEHDEALIKNWNNLVSNEDIIFCLGDFSLASKYYTLLILEQLNGIKYFFKGNHDKKQNIKLFKKFGTLLPPIQKVIIHNQLYILCHYPLESWEGMSAQKSIHFHGHSHHDTLRKLKNRYNVNVTFTNYKPINIESKKYINPNQ